MLLTLIKLQCFLNFMDRVMPLIGLEASDDRLLILII